MSGFGSGQTGLVQTDGNEFWGQQATKQVFHRHFAVAIQIPQQPGIKLGPEVPPSVTGGLDTVGVRLPESDIARALIRAAGVPNAKKRRA